MDLASLRAWELAGPSGHDRVVNSLSDSQLWRLAATGQADAFGVLFDRHRRPIYNFAFRRSGDWSQAEDATAMVFLEAWRRRSEVAFSGESALPWLLGVARNVTRNQWRTRRRYRAALERLPRTAAADGEDDDVVARLDDERRMHEVLRALSGLSVAHREVIELCVWAELSYEDAAELLDVPIGTLRSRLARARQHLTVLEREPGLGGGHALGEPPTAEEAQT